MFTNMFTCYYCGVFIEKLVYTKFCLDWILSTWPYMSLCNAWPEAIYCCFTRTTLFTTCLYNQS